MKYVFIVNPIAGNDNKVKIFSRIKSTFRLIDDEMIVEPTHAQGEAKLIAPLFLALCRSKMHPLQEKSRKRSTSSQELTHKSSNLLTNSLRSAK